MSYGGGYGRFDRGGGNRYGYGRYDRVNEEDVPESKHSIFIRGLPGKMSTDEIRDYFEDKIGPVSFDFVKTSPDNQRLFIAVRFESRDDAKEAMEKFSDRDLLGYKCDLQWFKDIRRYAQYQNARGGGAMRRSYGQPRGGGYRGSDRDRRRRESDRSRSPPSRGSRSRSRGSSKSSRSSRSRSKSRGSRARNSRSRSRSPKRAEKRSRSKSVDKLRSISPDEQKDGDRKKENKPKRRRSASSSSAHSEGSRGGSGRRSRQRKSRDDSRVSISPPPPLAPLKPREDLMCIASSASPSPPPAPPLPPPVPPAKIQINMKEKVPPPPPQEEVAAKIQATTFSFPIEADDDVIIKNDRNLTFRERPPAAQPPKADAPTVAPKDLPPPPAPPSFRNASPPVPRGSFRPITTVENAENEVNHMKWQPAESTDSPSKLAAHSLTATATSSNGASSKPQYPATAKMFAELKSFQDSVVKGIKYVPKEDEELGGLRLSSLSAPDGDDKDRAVLLTREARIAALDDLERERFLLQKRKLEAAFRNDCETYAFVAKKLLSKDPTLEQSLRLSFIENIEDLEKQFMEKIDALLQQ